VTCRKGNIAWQTRLGTLRSNVPARSGRRTAPAAERNGYAARYRDRYALASGSGGRKSIRLEVTLSDKNYRFLVMSSIIPRRNLQRTLALALARRMIRDVSREIKRQGLHETSVLSFFRRGKKSARETRVFSRTLTGLASYTSASDSYHVAMTVSSRVRETDEGRTDRARNASR